MGYNCSINLNLLRALNAGGGPLTLYKKEEKKKKKGGGNGEGGATTLQQEGNLFSNNNVSLISLHTAVDSCSDLIIGMW